MKNQTIKGHIVDVIAREIYDGEITISNGMQIAVNLPVLVMARWKAALLTTVM